MATKMKNQASHAAIAVIIGTSCMGSAAYAQQAPLPSAASMDNGLLRSDANGTSPGPSLSEVSGAARAAAASDRQPAQLEEIVVTAQRRSEKAQSVPVAISTFSAKMMTNLQITSSRDLANFVPGLNITRANVASVPFLRGVGNFTATPGNEAAISTYVDDVYYASPAASTFSFNNTSRIEVLKGPQGTLFGRNAAGGVISIYTRDPTSNPEVQTSAGYSNYNTFSGSFYGSTGLAPDLAVDLSVYAQRQGDGWGHNTFNGLDTYLSNEISVRSKMVYAPSSTWKIRIIGDFDKTRNDSSSVLNIIPGTRTLLGYDTAPEFFSTSQNFSSIGLQQQYGASLRIDHDLDWVTATSITAWRRSTGAGHQDTDVSPLNYSSSAFSPKQTTTTQEFQLASPAGSKIKWIVGAYLFLDNAGLNPIEQFGPPYIAHPGSTQDVFSVQHTTSYAGYSQVTVPVFANTNVTAGLRYTDDRRSIDARFIDLNGVQFNQVHQSADFPKVTYRVSVDQNLAKDMLLYASYNRGFKSGNYAVNSPAAAPVKPEVIDAYEVGLKSELLNRTLRVNLSAFYYRFNDLQVQESLAAGTILLNAASATYKGADLELNYVVTERLSLIGAFEVLQAKYLSFPAAVFNYPCTSIKIPGCAKSVNGGGYYVLPGNAAGKRIPYAENGSATVSATYEIPVGPGHFLLTGSTAYHPGFYFDVQNTLEQRAYALFDASVSWSSSGDIWNLKVWGKNLADEHYYAQQQVNATSANYSANAPRTFGFTIAYRYR